MYEKLILTISTVICPIHPFQSASFDLGHDSSITSSLYFNGNARERGRQFRQMSEQLAHLWKELNQNPTILYAYQSDLCKEFAQAMKKVNIMDNTTEEIYDSYLVIIDRSMDTKTPLMYDLAFQVSTLMIINRHVGARCFFLYFFLFLFSISTFSANGL